MARAARLTYQAGYGMRNGTPRLGASGRKKATSRSTATIASAEPRSRRVMR